MIARLVSLRPVVAVIALLVATPRSAAAQAPGANPETAAVTAPLDTVAVAARPDTAAVTAPAHSPLVSRALSPGYAFELALAVSLVPALIAVSLDPPGSAVAPEAAVSIGLAAGMIAGPAIGLACGGRRDLATRGVIVRSLGVAACAAGVIGFGTAFADEKGSGSGFMLLGAAGGLVTAVSWIHDVAITPSATAQGRPLHAELGIRRDGLVSVRVRF